MQGVVLDGVTLSWGPECVIDPELAPPLTAARLEAFVRQAFRCAMPLGVLTQGVAAAVGGKCNGPLSGLAPKVHPHTTPGGPDKAWRAGGAGVATGRCMRTS